MTLFKSNIMRIVFKYLMIGHILFGRQFSAILFAQLTTNSQWSETAKALTIFQPGDAVNIQVMKLDLEDARNEFFSGIYTINPNGYIVMPFIGEIRVRGLTEIELMQTLQEELNIYMTNLYVSVRPLIRVTMQGAFQRPGNYPQYFHN